MLLKLRFSAFTAVSIVLALSALSFPGFAQAQSCPFPWAGETEKGLQNQEEIPRGTCKTVTIRGKLSREIANMSLDQSIGSGFHFDTDNGPTTLQTNDATVEICSDGTACGSASIMIDINGVSTEIGSVRSDTGRWRYIGGLSGECPVTGNYTTRVAGGGIYQDELILGKWKIWEQKNVRYSCNLLINRGCDCGRCYPIPYCIESVPCPDGFEKISPFCCRQYPGDGTETIYCIQTRYGPYLYEWRCN